MPNSFAYIVLLSWPLISILFFKKMKVIPAVIWTILGGYLLLPVKTSFDLPMIPPLDKESISILSALFGCVAIKKIKIQFLPKNGLEKWFILAILLIPLATVLTNQYPVFNGSVWVQRLFIYDAISAIVISYIKLLPFIIGLQLVKTYDNQLELFKCLVISCLFYSILILYEIRMSPQLHTTFYGFFPHSFGQQIRYGGFRAVVFMGHGLSVSLFLAICLGAAIALYNNKIRTLNLPPIIVVVYLFLVLLLSKSVGPVIYGLLFIFLLLVFPKKSIKSMTKALMLFVLIHAILSSFQLFPNEEIISVIANYDAERAQSLEFRFFHEKLIVEHVNDQFLLGLGFWGRGTLYNSVLDSTWIQIFSTYGISGLLASYGLILLVVFKSLSSVKVTRTNSAKLLLLSHAFIVAVIMLDQIPNSSLSEGYIWLIIGMLFGRANYLLKEAKTVVQTKIDSDSLNTFNY